MAFNSSEAVMNNRFIKMFWHTDKGNVKNRLGGGGFGPGKFSKTISNDINHEEVTYYFDIFIESMFIHSSRWILRKSRKTRIGKRLQSRKIKKCFRLRVSCLRRQRKKEKQLWLNKVESSSQKE